MDVTDEDKHKDFDAGNLKTIEDVMDLIDNLSVSGSSVYGVETTRAVPVPIGFSFKKLFQKVNFNKKDFYEAIQPVTDHYRIITDSNEFQRTTPPLLDISQKWETDELYSTDLETPTEYLKHVDAVDDLFSLLYSFKGLLDRYPKGADYSTPGLKTTFELLWGEIWAYYVTIPRVTFSWVYWDILHCIKDAGGPDWTREGDGGGDSLGEEEEVPPSITSFRDAKQPGYDSGSPTEVPGGVEGGGLPVVGVIDGEKVNPMMITRVDSLPPDQLLQLKEALEQILPKKDIPKPVKPKEVFPEKSEIQNENRLKELIDKAEKEIPDLRPLNEWSDALKAYTNKGTQHDHTLKKLILFRFRKIHKLPDVFPEDQELLVSYYYQALIATNYDGFFDVVQAIEKLRPAANEIRFRIKQFGMTEIPAIYYLFKDNRFDVDYKFIPAVADAGKIEDFIKEYFPSYVKMLIGGVKITNIDDSWKVFKGVYIHFRSPRIQKDMNDKIEKAEPRLIIDELTTLIEGPKPLVSF